MSGTINRVMLIGRLGKDPEMRFTPAGKAVTNFTMATSETWKDSSGEKQERTEWHKVVTWGKLAEIVAKYLSKGKLAYIEGRLQTRSWDDKDGNKRYVTEIVANVVTMLEKANSSHEEHQDDGGGVGADLDQGYLDDVPF